MKCLVCNGSNIQAERVDEQIRAGENIVLLQMDILVCETCGERYFDKKNMKKIEKVREQLRDHKLKVKEVGKVMRAVAA